MTKKRFLVEISSEPEDMAGKYSNPDYPRLLTEAIDKLTRITMLEVIEDGVYANFEISCAGLFTTVTELPQVRG